MNGRSALVIDSSAALAVVLNEDDSASIDREIRLWTSRRAQILVPELFWIEVANTLIRRYRQPFDVVLETVATIDRIGVTTVRSDRAAVLAAIASTLEHGLTAYDATYLALAESLEANLLTLDRELAAAAGDRAVKLEVGDVKETRVSYRLEPWISWDEAASYLKAVRQATLEEAGRR